jgi:hypothetical protein
MFSLLRILQFNSAKAVLKRGNTIPNKEGVPFSDIRDSIILILNKFSRNYY